MASSADIIAVQFKRATRESVFRVKWDQVWGCVACLLIAASLGAGAALALDEPPTREAHEILRQPAAIPTPITH